MSGPESFLPKISSFVAVLVDGKNGRKAVILIPRHSLPVRHSGEARICVFAFDLGQPVSTTRGSAKPMADPVVHL